MLNSKQKLFITFIVFAIILSVVNVSVEKLYFEDSAQKVALNNAFNKTKEREGVFKNFLFQSEQTLYSIQKLDSFNEYLLNSSKTNQLENIFLSYAMSQTAFMQLRYIDKDGFEKIRVDRDKENLQPFVVAKNKLQNKADRYYFYDSKTKPLNKVWFSALDLNMERGKVEVPYRPTIRAMLPIQKDGKFNGILIINYLMDGFIKKFTNAPLYDMILCDAKGYPLYHYEKSKSWGYYRNPKYTIENDFPTQYKSILNNEITQTEHFVSRKLDVPVYGGLYLILQLKKSYIDEQNKQSDLQFISISLITLITSIILAFLVVKIFSNKLLNITKLKTLNESLEERTKDIEVFKLAVDSVEAGVTLADATKEDIPLIYVNKSFEEITGYKHDDAIGKNCRFLQGDDTDQVELETVRYAIKNKISCDVELRNYTKSGKLFWNHLILSPLLDKDGELKYYVGIQNDITRQKKFEKNLKKEKLKKDLALQSGNIGVWEWIYDTNTLIWDDMMYRIYGIEKNEEKPSPYEMWSNTINPNDKQRVEKNLFNAKETNGEYNATFEITTPKGETRYIHALGRNELDSNGNTVRMVGINTDITSIKINEKRIVQQKEEFETIFKLTRDGIAIINLETKFINCNDAFSGLTGYTKEELLTKTCRELTVEEDREKNDYSIKYAIENEYIENIEKRCTAKDGKVFTVNMSASLLPDKQRLLLTLKDMTSIKLLHEQAKLVSMGEMIGNIAHQWRQPLSVISTGATGLKLQKEYNVLSDEQFVEICDSINTNAQYLSKTIDDFRDFVKGERKIVEFKLIDTIDSFLHLVEGTIKNYDITIVKNIQEDIIINGYPNELIQCFINIFNNAKDALQKIADDRYYFISAKIINNEIVIAFKDNAGGIDENILPHIFEPYFTTKHKSQGTGLGLSMVYNLVTDGLKGTIEAENINYEFKGNKYIGVELLIKLPL